MKLKIILMIAMCVAVLPLLTCTTGPRVTSAINVTISCDKFEQSNHYSSEFDAEVGTKIKVDLCSNPTTGFEWEYEIIGEDVLEATEHEFIEPESDVVGASGRDVWTFTAIKNGEAEVRLEYSQPCSVISWST